VGSFGGAELSLLQLIDEWGARDPDVEFSVVAPAPAGLFQAELASREIEQQCIDFGAWVHLRTEASPLDEILELRMNSWAVQALAGLIAEFRPNLVVTNTIVCPWAAIAARTAGIPHAWFVREFGDLDHGMHFSLGRDATFRDIGRLSELVVANSVAVRDHLSAWVPVEKIAVAYPAIDIPSVRRLAAVNEAAVQRPAGACHVVMVGRIRDSKGQPALINAIARLRSEGTRVTATLVGDSETPEARAVLRLIDELDLSDRVHVVGEVSNPYPYVAEADVAVMASRCEAFGRVTLEYLAIGTPVIASATGANLELVEHGRTGWLFDLQQPEQLDNALREAASDPSATRRRGDAARASVDDRISTAYPFAEIVPRLTSVANHMVTPLDAVPEVLRLWLHLPENLERHLDEITERQKSAHADIAWKVGRVATGPGRLLAHMRRAAVRRREET
jgi:glycosyltransferase involved in cell wall biosynthesis